jgi:hypothetical protein
LGDVDAYTIEKRKVMNAGGIRRRSYTNNQNISISTRFISIMSCPQIAGPSSLADEVFKAMLDDRTTTLIEGIHFGAITIDPYNSISSRSKASCSHGAYVTQSKDTYVHCTTPGLLHESTSAVKVLI